MHGGMPYTRFQLPKSVKISRTYGLHAPTLALTCGRCKVEACRDALKSAHGCFRWDIDELWRGHTDGNALPWAHPYCTEHSASYVRA